MQLIHNKITKIIVISSLTILLLPIITYIIKALFSLGRISGTFIRFLSTI